MGLFQGNLKNCSSSWLKCYLRVIFQPNVTGLAVCTILLSIRQRLLVFILYVLTFFINCEFWWRTWPCNIWYLQDVAEQRKSEITGSFLTEIVLALKEVQVIFFSWPNLWCEKCYFLRCVACSRAILGSLLNISTPQIHNVMISGLSVTVCFIVLLSWSDKWFCFLTILLTFFHSLSEDESKYFIEWDQLHATALCVRFDAL